MLKKIRILAAIRSVILLERRIDFVFIATHKVTCVIHALNCMATQIGIKMGMAGIKV